MTDGPYWLQSVAWLVGAVVLGALVYCLLVVWAARAYRLARVATAHQRANRKDQPLPAISVLKPLRGLDQGLEENLRSFFTQEYPEYELLFAVRDRQDPAVALVEKLQAEYPGVPSQLVLTGEPPWRNAKAWSLQVMQGKAKQEVLLMADSDIRAAQDLLQTVGREFAADQNLMIVTCPYRAVGGPGWPSRLEALGMNTEFWAGVLVARLVEGVNFTIGPTVAARKAAIHKVGGWPYLQEFLAEDFVLGSRAAELGLKVELSAAVVEHRIGDELWAANVEHRLRWCRSTRRSRPAGYIGQVFTNPLPLALILVLLQPALWPVLAATAVLRAWAGWAVAERLLRDPASRRDWWLIPLQDLLSFGFWAAGFFGDKIVWRGEAYRVTAEGKLQPYDKQ